jgi:predicted dehydrogenase
MADTIYKVLLIGTGFGRRVQLPVFREHPRFEVTAVASGHAESARDTAREFGIPHHGADWRKLLESAPVDVVSVTSPVIFHREQAVGALRAGKDLLLEKPVARDAAEAEAILGARAESGRRAAVNHEFRYRPDVLTLKRMLADGRLGELRGLEFRDLFPGWADPDRPTHGWLSLAEMGGGMLGAVGSHNVDMMRFLTGREVQAASGSIWTVVTRRADAGGVSREVTADDASGAVLDLGDGVGARMDIRASVWWNEHSIRVFGSRATATLDGSWSIHLRRPDGSEETVEADEDLRWTSDEKDIRKPLFHRLLDRFARRLDGEVVEDLATLEEGVAVMRVLDAIRAGGR